MSNFGTMKSRITDEVVRDDLSSQIEAAIQTAIMIWEPERFWFNEKRFQLYTYAGTEYYALSSSLTETNGDELASGVGLIEIDAITLTYNGQPYALADATQQMIDRQQSPSSLYTGQPAYYGIFGDSLRLSPIPDAAYQCTISGLATLATLTDDNDTNAWMVEGEALIRNQAKVIIYRDVVRDVAGTQAATAAMMEAFGPLKRRTLAKVGLGRIQPWGL